MSNRALWNIRQRHVWIATSRKGKSLKRRERVRCGLQQALERKAKSKQEEAAPASPQQ